MEAAVAASGRAACSAVEDSDRPLRPPPRGRGPTAGGRSTRRRARGEPKVGTRNRRGTNPNSHLAFRHRPRPRAAVSPSPRTGRLFPPCRGGATRRECPFDRISSGNRDEVGAPSCRRIPSPHPEKRPVPPEPTFYQGYMNACIRHAVAWGESPLSGREFRNLLKDLVAWKL